jgi:hypothetical protein
MFILGASLFLFENDLWKKENRRELASQADQHKLRVTET